MKSCFSRTPLKFKPNIQEFISRIKLKISRLQVDPTKEFWLFPPKNTFFQEIEHKKYRVFSRPSKQEFDLVMTSLLDFPFSHFFRFENRNQSLGRKSELYVRWSSGIIPWILSIISGMTISFGRSERSTTLVRLQQ